MDNHPIPQDVTGFQFRLIGDMTIKQFAYLAAGVVLAWICYSLPFFFLIKFPLVIFFAGTGILLAFIPLEGRPADTMILYFFKAVFSPTQYTYQQSNAKSPLITTSVGQQAEKKEERQKKEEKIHIAPSASTNFDNIVPKNEDEEQKEASLEQSTSQPETAATADEQETQLSQEAIALEKSLQQAKEAEATVQKNTEEALQAHQKATDLERELQTVLEQKQALEAKLLELQKQLTQKPQQVFTPSDTPAAPTITANVRKVPPSLSKTVGTPFVTDVPNLISGVVKDPRGNVLPNILIEVKDRDNNPVRAFKTNPLGQFASATPVINGTYTITFEDPNGKHRFDTVELTANDTVLEPLEVISVDAREELRKELFGN